MKRPDHNAEESVKTFLDSLGNPPQATIEAARGRLVERFRAGDQLPPFEVEETPRRRGSPWAMAAVAASLLAAAGVVGVVALRNSSDPVVAIAGNQAKIVTLSDGSRLNMRPGSELSFYRAADDRCIQLVRGDVVVNAAKQEAGHHLCVQTKDFTVTVVGTLFTVSVEEKGSSVVVKEGTVWVQQGSTRKTLVAGQRLSTIAQPEATPQTSALTAAPLPQGAEAPPQARATAKPAPQSFEIISIKKMPPNPNDDRPHRRMSPGGLRATNVTLKDLVLMAYDLPVFRLSGGPAWIDKDRFEVETKFGSDASAWIERILKTPSEENNQQFVSMNQEMMQDMLAARFKLKVRRTTEQTSAYALVLSGKTSKLQAAVSESANRLANPGGQVRGPMTIAQLAKFLSESVGQPVVDRTGLPGIYDIELNFVPERLREQLAAARGDSPGAGGDGGGRGGPGTGLEGQDLRSALQDQLGLKLETTKAPVEFFVIESVEQPSEN